MNIRITNQTTALARIALTTAAIALAGVATPANAGATLDRIKSTGTIKMGYFPNAKPFTSAAGGAAEGYGIDLCQRIAAELKGQLRLSDLKIEWVDVGGFGGDIPKILSGNVDVMCTPAAQTLLRREDVSYSIAVFPAGVRAVVRKDAPQALRDALGQDTKPGQRVMWRGSPAATTLQKKKAAVMVGTTTQAWLANRMATFDLSGTVVEALSYKSGLQAVIDGKADVFFGDRAAAMGAMDDAMSQQLVVLDRMMTQEAIGLMMPRGDEDLRLAIDRALSDTYRSAEFPGMYQKWFGKPDELTRNFFLWTALPH